MNDKILSLLGMCRRAGKLTLGADKSIEAIQKKKAMLVLVSADTAPRTEKEMRFQGKDALPVRRLSCSKEELSRAIGASAGTVSVTDEGFAAKILQLIDNGGMNL